jgi:ubiquinone/menaquinone biosynthesis C-methylase UbiE
VRLDVVAENPLESAASLGGLLPTGVVKVVWSLTMARTLLAAVELGVFAALEGGERTSADLAQELECDAQGMRTLLASLSGFGMLRRKAETYRLTREAKRYLTSLSGTDFTDALRMGDVLDRSFRNLANAVKTGEREDFHAGLDDEDWRSYLRGLGALAGMTASEVARKIKLAEPKRLLDVGGGHGQFSVAMCNKHASLTSEILDLPGAIPVGEEMVAKAGMSERVSYRAGDMRAAEWGEGFDVLFLFNILHNLQEADAARALEQAFAALRPGGTIAVLEAQHAGGDGDLSFQEAFGEIFFYVLSSSMTWPAPVLRGWMEAAGFSSPKQKKLLTLPGAALLIAQRPA